MVLSQALLFSYGSNALAKALTLWLRKSELRNFNSNAPGYFSSNLLVLVVLVLVRRNSFSLVRFEESFWFPRIIVIESVGVHNPSQSVDRYTNGFWSIACFLPPSFIEAVNEETNKSPAFDRTTAL